MAQEEYAFIEKVRAKVSDFLEDNKKGQHDSEAMGEFLTVVLEIINKHGSRSLNKRIERDLSVSWKEYYPDKPKRKNKLPWEYCECGCHCHVAHIGGHTFEIFKNLKKHPDQTHGYITEGYYLKEGHRGCYGPREKFNSFQECDQRAFEILKEKWKDLVDLLNDSKQL